MSARFLIGDVFEQLAMIPDDSVDLVLTSPPFLALRSYLPADHPDKHKEIGSEPDPATFLATLLALTAEWDRVLAPHGSIAVELGDTHSGSGGAGGDYGEQGLREGQAKFDGSGRRNRPADVAAGILAPTRRPGPEGRDSIDGWPLAKSLCMIPQLYATSLAYGRNLLTGEPCDRWRVRNIVRWCRPNPPVGALGDKFRPATSEMTIACKSRTRYFDLDAVRGPGSDNTHARTAVGVDRRTSTGKHADDERRGGNFSTLDTIHETNGAPPLDWWSIPTQPVKLAHYATFPEALCVKPIEAMVPRRVCTVCGEPSRRIVESSTAFSDGTPKLKAEALRETAALGHRNGVERIATTTGWSDCGHNSWRRGIVLDPFAGSGTTLKVAVGLGRDAIGIDIDARNAELARERCGMFLEVDEPVRPVAVVELPA